MDIVRHSIHTLPFVYLSALGLEEKRHTPFM
jgi:hypothetical protein